MPGPIKTPVDNYFRYNLANVGTDGENKLTTFFLDQSKFRGATPQEVRSKIIKEVSRLSTEDDKDTILIATDDGQYAVIIADELELSKVTGSLKRPAIGGLKTLAAHSRVELTTAQGLIKGQVIYLDDESEFSIFDWDSDGGKPNKELEALQKVPTQGALTPPLQRTSNALNTYGVEVHENGVFVAAQDAYGVKIQHQKASEYDFGNPQVIMGNDMYEDATFNSFPQAMQAHLKAKMNSLFEPENVIKFPLQLKEGQSLPADLGEWDVKSFHLGATRRNLVHEGSDYHVFQDGGALYVVMDSNLTKDYYFEIFDGQGNVVIPYQQEGRGIISEGSYAHRVDLKSVR